MSKNSLKKELRPLMEDDFLTFEVLSKPDVELARS